jgi:peptide deformylase
MTADAFPFRTAISHDREGEHDVLSWSTDHPPLHARYRIEWRFRSEHAGTGDLALSASDMMRGLGIVQEGAEVLARPTRPLGLPGEAAEARRIVAELEQAADRVAAVHNFGKGMGIAAPQIGIDRAAAIVRPPGAGTVALLNPRIIESSTAGDEQYEGCLSFFDVRGMVQRPLAIHVEHCDTDGARRITRFERGAARLVAHEVDHLDGLLYRCRMRAGVEPIPVTEYRGGGQQWRY